MGAPDRGGLAGAIAVVEAAASEVDRRGRFPRAGLAALAGAGVLGCTVSRSHGGRGLWLREAADIVRRVAGACASTATVLQSHLTAVAVLEETGPHPLREDIAAGRHLCTTAVTFPGTSGSSLRRGAVTDLHGTREWVTAAGEADSYVWSCGDELWLVAATAPGLLVPSGHEPIGLRGSAATTVTADPVSVPAEARLATRGPRALADVAFGWFVVLGTAVSLGIMDGAISATGDAIEAGGSEAHRAGVLGELARMKVRADSVRSMFNETTDAVVWEQDGAREALLALRAAAVQTAIGVTDRAMKVCQLVAPAGAPGVERHFRDARAAYAVPPTPDTALDELGRSMCRGKP